MKNDDPARTTLQKGRSIHNQGDRIDAILGTRNKTGYRTQAEIAETASGKTIGRTIDEPSTTRESDNQQEIPIWPDRVSSPKNDDLSKG